jgi:hypothetical protein
MIDFRISCFGGMYVLYGTEAERFLFQDFASPRCNALEINISSFFLKYTQYDGVSTKVEVNFYIQFSSDRLGEKP